MSKNRFIADPEDVIIAEADNAIIDDREFQVPIISIVCGKCGNLINDGIGKTCRAFPNGIPMKIWKGENNHKKSVVGDNGIIFIERK